MSKRLKDMSVNIRSCRICLNNKCGDFVDIGDKLLKLYEYCLGPFVEIQDSPEELCTKCVKCLKGYAKFKKKAIKSESMWKSLLNLDVKCQAENILLHQQIQKPVYESHCEILSDNEFTEEYIKNEYEESVDIKDEIVQDNHTHKFVNIQDDTKEYIFQIKEEVTDTENVMKCKKCSKEYKLMKSYLKHTKSCKRKLSDHPVIKLPVSSQYYCGLCEFKSTELSLLQQHLHEHWGNNDCKCGLCGFVANDLAEIIVHRFKHHPTEYQVVLNCHICSKKCVKPLYLEFHYRSVHLGKKGGFCFKCNRSYSHPNRWRNHQRFHIENNYICDICGRKFLFRNEIKSHLIDHSEIRKHICDVCGRSFKRLRNMTLHYKTVHVDHKTVKCHHCNKFFKSQKTLEQHLKREEQEKLYECSVCLKRYSSQKVLESHMFWHTGERPHVCHICGSKYKAKSALKMHLKKHTGVKSFKCELCDKSFFTSISLRRHQSVHTGERAYKCQNCERSFHSKGLLREHCAKRHEVKAGINTKPHIIECS